MGQQPIVFEIEEALVRHWSHFGQWPRGALVEDAGTVRYETPIVQLPYNGVVRTRITGDSGPVIERVLDAFSRRRVAFVWWHHPTATPNDLAARLSDRGLQLAEEVVGMSLDLASRGPRERPPSGLRFVEVLDERGMRSYAEVIFRYWEVSAEAQPLVEEVNRYWSPGRSPFHRWVVLDEHDRTIGKAMLSLAAPSGVAAIYGMSVTPEARGRGVASALTETLLDRAEALGCHRVVLHSSEMARGLYERVGFVAHCEMPVYANAVLWATRET